MIKNKGQLRVMSGLDEDDYEEGIPDMDEQTLIRSKVSYEENEVALRQKAFTKILNQVGENFKKEQKVGFDTGADIKEVITKFDPKKIKIRRAFSLSNFGEEEDWVCVTEEDQQDQTLRNNPEKVGDIKGLDEKRRYSFPLSPKKKVDFIGMPDTELFANQIEDIKEA